MGRLPFNVEIKQERLLELWRGELEVANEVLPAILFTGAKHAKGSDVAGEIDFDSWTIKLYLASSSSVQAASKLSLLTADVNRTLLHELRHAWQYVTWGRAKLRELNRAYASAYWNNPAELDARSFENEMGARFRLVRVSRPVARSGFARLNHAQAAIRA